MPAPSVSHLIPEKAKDPLAAALVQVVEGRLTLARNDARTLLESLLEAPAANPQNDLRLAALLGAMGARGETEQELAGFVDALRQRAVPIPLAPDERARLVDTCGTGGDMAGTFNISTAAALVAAAAGASVAKHGNRAVTSKAGSADVLEALGIPVDLTPALAAEALRRHGFAFLSATTYHPAMAAVMPVRKQLGVRTVFNLLGPLANPAGATRQVVGVYAPRLVELVANTLTLLGTRQAFVVHGAGLDEFSTAGPTMVGHVIEDEAQFGTIDHTTFGVPLVPSYALFGGDAQHNARLLTDIFAGKRDARRDIVVVNAAAVLVVADLAESFLEGVALAQETIDSGKVTNLVAALGA